jgi:hypothetical protein
MQFNKVPDGTFTAPAAPGLRFKGCHFERHLVTLTSDYPFGPFFRLPIHG